jgi:hypothetical protein
MISHITQQNEETQAKIDEQTTTIKNLLEGRL